MTSTHDPCGKIYTVLSEEWTTFPWFLQPVFIPQEFREHPVLVLGWTTGRRGHVSIAMITPNMPNGASPNHYIQIKAPRRKAVINESVVTLRKNKTFSALVDNSYVRLDRVWEVPFAILSVVPRMGMQLMLRAMSMEKIMSIYATWGWGQAWGQTYQSNPEHLREAAYCQNGNDSGSRKGIRHGGEAVHPPMMRQPFRGFNGLASPGMVGQDGDAMNEVHAGSVRTGNWDSTHRPDSEDGGQLEEEEMVYAGDAHCEMLARLLRESRRRPSSRTF